MKKVFCSIAMFILMINSAHAAEIKAFHWVDDEDYPPLIYRGEDGKPAGVFFQIMREVFHRLDIPLHAETYPWARTQKIVADGKADGMVTILTNQRKQFVVGSDPILLVSEYIFTSKNNPKVKKIMAIRSLEEIQSYRVVETIGAGWTKEKLKGAVITWVPTMDSAFNMLLKNRADIFILNRYVGEAFLQQKIKEEDNSSEDFKNIITNPYPLSTIAYRLLIRTGSPFEEILDDFNHTIHQMQMDGTIQHILEGIHQPQQVGVQRP